MRFGRNLNRILASPPFVKSDRLAKFLRFAVEMTLEGRTEELKESTIGVEVYGREPDYSPKIDAIVRVEARRLRRPLRTESGFSGIEVRYGDSKRTGTLDFRDSGARPLSDELTSPLREGLDRG